MSQPGFFLPQLDGFPAKGVHITFENGWTVSVQFGAGNYCDNYNAAFRESPPHSPDAEIAAWSASNEWHRFKSGDTVQGRCSPADVLAFMNEIAAQ